MRSGLCYEGNEFAFLKGKDCVLRGIKTVKQKRHHKNSVLYVSCAFLFGSSLCLPFKKSTFDYIIVFNILKFVIVPFFVFDFAFLCIRDTQRTTRRTIFFEVFTIYLSCIFTSNSVINICLSIT